MRKLAWMALEYGNGWCGSDGDCEMVWGHSAWEDTK